MKENGRLEDEYGGRDGFSIKAAFVGKRIVGISVKPGDDSLRFRFSDGTDAVIETEADCCSETWFSDLIGVRLAIGNVVREVIDRDMDGYNVEDGRGRQESDAAYGFTIRTDGGDLDVIFRNSSNGYYGGSCYLASGTVDTEGWTEIDDDWQAAGSG